MPCALSFALDQRRQEHGRQNGDNNLTLDQRKSAALDATDPIISTLKSPAEFFTALTSFKPVNPSRNSDQDETDNKAAR
jgi:hypothetical protein